MAIKLFVTDLDGTLLDENHMVSDENRAAVQAAAAQGVTVTIATGRMYASALPYARQLGVDVPIITYNGALIKSVSGEVLFESYLEPKAVTAVLDYCRKAQWFVQLHRGDNLYFREYTDKAVEYEARAGLKGEVCGEGVYDRTEGVAKMIIISDTEAQSDEVVREINRDFAGCVFAVKSLPLYVEILRPGVNKATALERLLEKMALTRGEVMAIGDSNNDLPMLLAAGCSVAMGNANDDVKAVCDYVTADYKNSGVAKAIRDYVLQA
jgi:HAD-superfamily hydrolase, subfamily IIB